MTSHANSSRSVLTALMVMLSWISAFAYGAWPVDEAQVPAPEPAAIQVAVRAPELRQEPPTVEVELYRHEDERVVMPWQEREQERRELAARSAFRPRIDDLAPESFRPLVFKVAAEYDLDPRLLAALITYESNWDPYAIGAARDTGLMQIIPSTAEWIAKKMDLREYDLLDPETNLTMGAWFLKTLIKEYGDLETALIVYNAGHGVLKHPVWDPYKYARRVLSIRDTGKYVA